MVPSFEDDLEVRFDSIEDTIAAFKRGEFIVALDSKDRENEGDLIIAAEDVTPEKMAFMIRYTSGYICAPLTPRLATKLFLPQMVANNEDPKKTAYTITVDAEHPDLTTGISAHDRALTLRLLASPMADQNSFRRPGHIAPLKARKGGVLERPGHTESAVEFCRLAGKHGVAAIAEMVEDGEEIEGVAERIGGGMMRRDACREFGKIWGLKVCAIEDLVEYVLKEQAGGNGLFARLAKI